MHWEEYVFSTFVNLVLLQMKGAGWLMEPRAMIEDESKDGRKQELLLLLVHNLIATKHAVQI